MVKNKIAILSYHEVNTTVKSSDNSNRMHPSYCISAKMFEKQMDYLKKNEFCLLSVEQIFGNGKKTATCLGSEKNVIITFDDGHIGNYLYAFSLLKKYGFTAVFFVTTNWIGRKGMMNWEQLKEMVESGMTIGSHTASHVPLSTLSDSQIKQELYESKMQLESKLNIKINYISLPHGDYDKRLESIAKKVGYKAVFTSEPKYLDNRDDSFFIGRLEMRKEYDMHYFISTVEKNCPKLTYKRLLNKIKFNVRFLIGINNYRKLYRLINRIELKDSR